MIKSNTMTNVVEATTFRWIIIEFIENKLDLFLIGNGFGSGTTALKAKILSSTLNGGRATIGISAQSIISVNPSVCSPGTDPILS